jgi:DNA-binding transcriptional LysR family regulator
MPQDHIRRYLKHGTLPQLCVFEASVRLGSLARAAQELHMAPPTASVQVKKLSETVGVPLFEHIGTHVYPTEAGRAVYAGCNEVFRALSALEQALVEMRGLVPRTRMELGSNEAIREAIAAGLGISILSRYTLGFEPQMGGLVCLDAEGFPIESYWHFVYPVGKHLSPAARSFMDFTRAEAKRLAAEGLARGGRLSESGRTVRA